MHEYEHMEENKMSELIETISTGLVRNAKLAGQLQASENHLLPAETELLAHLRKSVKKDLRTIKQHERLLRMPIKAVCLPSNEKTFVKGSWGRLDEKTS